jgi:hypothetical protein
MRQDQLLRAVGMLCSVMAYGLFVGLNGGHTLMVLGYRSSPLAAVFLTVVVLALPETIEMLPFGPTRDDT